MKKIAILAALLVIPGTLSAQVKVGTTGANFLQIGVSPRAVGMGEAFLAVADDAAAIYYNPGALSLVDQRQLLLSHTEWPADIKCEFLAFAMPVPGDAGVVGVSATLLHMDDMEVTTPFYPNGTGQTFSTHNMAVGLSYSRFLTDKFSFGITAKYIQLYAHDVDATGWSADVGTNYETGFKSLRIAMAVTNFGPDLTFITESFPLPINFNLGFAIDPLHSGPHRLTVAFAGSHPSDNQERYTMGMEYWYSEMVALRTGYKIRYDDEDLSFGGGLRTSLGSMAAAIDYAYVPYAKLQDTHRLSLGIGF
ncbi:PorV/PorQ family protein [Candidatus Fermentibacteria bacterium]|nr:PorV/PorQ family protein [Candidatus Fermentibacteria bacterium]